MLTKAKSHAEVLNLSLQDEVAERRQKERALRDGEALLAEAQRMAQLGSWSYHPIARRAVWSDETYRIYGTDRAASLPSCRALVARIHRDDRRRVYALFKRAMRYGEPFETEFRIDSADGKARWIHTLGQPRVDEQGRTYEVRGTVLDITERKTPGAPARRRAQGVRGDRQRRSARRGARVRCARCWRRKARRTARSICSRRTVRWWRRRHRACRPNIASIPRAFRSDRIPACTRAARSRDMQCWRRDLATDRALDTTSAWRAERRSASVLGGADPGQLQTDARRAGRLLHASRASRPRTSSRLIDRIGNIAKIALERDEAEQRIRQLAHYDELTGLPNRALFNQALEHALSHAQREGSGWRCCSSTSIASRTSTTRSATMRAIAC